GRADREGQGRHEARGRAIAPGGPHDDRRREGLLQGAHARLHDTRGRGRAQAARDRERVRGLVPGGHERRPAAGEADADRRPGPREQAEDMTQGPARRLVLYEDRHWRSLRPLTDLLPVPALAFGASDLAARWLAHAQLPLLAIEARSHAMACWDRA